MNLYKYFSGNWKKKKNITGETFPSHNYREMIIRAGWFSKNSQIFLGIWLTSSVMIRWTMVLIYILENYQKAQHTFSLCCEIIILQNCHFMKYFTFKISRFGIYVRECHYALCLQVLLFIKQVIFQGARFSTHITLGVKNGKWSQILQYCQILQ